MSNFIKNALVPLLLRLGLAVVFVYHGIDMVRPEHGYGTSWRPALAVPDQARVPVQAAVAWGELLGGVALALGLLTRVAAAGLALIMVGAIVTVTRYHGFNNLNHGWEYNFVLIVVCVAVLLLGGGPIGVGHWLGFERKT